MNVLIDTCVVMDFLQSREPFFEDALTLLRFAAEEKLNGFITAKSASDIHYLTHRCTHSEEESRIKLNKLLSILGLLDTTAEDIFHALSSNVSDFEDAIMIETGVRSRMDCLVTRNLKDYSKSRLLVYTPADLIRELEN